MGSELSEKNIKRKSNLNHALRLSKFLYIAVQVLLLFAYFSLSVLKFGYSSHFEHPKGIFFFVCIYVVVLLWLLRVYNGFNFGFSGILELVFSMSLSSTMADGLMYVVISIYLNRILGIGYLLLFCIAGILLNICYANIGQKLYFRHVTSNRTVIIYRRESDLSKLREIKLFPHYFDIVKYIENPESSSAAIELIDDCELVVMAGIKPQIRNGIMKYCLQNGILAYIEPKIGDILMCGGKHVNSFSVPVMKVSRAEPAPEFLFFKRFFDILISLTAIIVLSPFMLISALIIKLGDGGPVFYRQVRLTKDGREFEILKFRSMRVDAESDGVARLASENDDRITPVGRFLRACRMDELPQLFNVLKGDMSIVGPRPERPEIARQYTEEIPSFDLRLQVKAGITGFAQVYGKYNTEPYDKLQMDLMYINNMSLLSDLWLMFATFKVLFQKESSSGVEEGQVTAVKSDGDTSSGK